MGGVRLNFTWKIIVTIVAVVGLVFYTGIVAYSGFTKIIRNVSERSVPNVTLLKIESLLNNVQKAENCSKSFLLTEDSVYYNDFYWYAHSYDNDMNEILLLVESREIQSQVDTLSHLLELKYINLDSLLNAYSVFRAPEALTKVMQNLTEIDEGTMPVEMNEKPLGKEEKPKKRNLWNRLLGGKKSEKTNPEEQSLELRRNQVKVRDSLIKNVKKKVLKIKEEELIMEKSIKLNEANLISRNTLISDQIDAITQKIEQIELNLIAKNEQMAAENLKNANLKIALFCITIVAMLLLMGYFIMNYVTHNNKYKAALKSARNEANDLAYMKERFFAAMSHEIRTPMNAVAGFTRQLAKSSLDENQREQVQIVEKSVDHLTYLINDILDFTKLKARKLQLEKIDFSPESLLAEVMGMGQLLVNDKNIILKYKGEIPDGLYLIGDPYRIKQILINLISNSIKFTENGSVELLAEVTTDPGQNNLRNLSLEVRDSGIGMTREQLDKVFLEFEQGDNSTSRNYGGSGLGLTITYKLVELMGGKIEIDSVPGKGTSIHIDLKLELGQGTELSKGDPITDEPISLPEGIRILVVDDDLFNRKLLASVFNQYSVLCDFAESGREALEIMKTNEFDIVLMDAHMPEMTGVDATREIRKMEKEHGKTSPIPIIALTAAVGYEDKKNYKLAGMNGFVSKPFDESDLILEINTLMKQEDTGNDQSAMHSESVAGIQYKLNYTSLEELSGNDPSFVIEMLEIFKNQMKAGLEDMEVYFEQQSWDAISEMAHKLCSSSKHLSANDLYAYLKKIETTAKNRTSPDQIQETLKKAQLEFREIAIEVDQKLNILKGS